MVVLNMLKKRPAKLSTVITALPKWLLLDAALVVAMWTFGAITNRRFWWITSTKPSLISGLLLAGLVWFLSDLILLLIRKLKDRKDK